MKFFSTILFLFFFEFAIGQVAGTPFISNPLFSKFSFNLTTTSSTTVNFTLHVATNSSRPILECGVVYSYNNNATTSNYVGRWVAASNFDGINVLTTTITNSFVYAPYYAIPYVILSTGTYYGTAIQFTPNFPTVTINGKLWAAANLGATSIANSNTRDVNSYGWYYQWGRGSDGHQLTSSGRTSILSSTSNPGNGNFITSSVSPYDWVSPQDNTLWQGVDGKNNPCPSGYRVPTVAEFSGVYNSLYLPWAQSYDYKGNFYNDGAGNDPPGWGHYWTSDVYSTGISYYKAYQYEKDNSNYPFYKGYAMPIRCIQN